MEHYNVPLLAESTYATTGHHIINTNSSTTTNNSSSSIISSNHHQLSTSNSNNSALAPTATTHHHKDHMLAAGNPPATPFISYSLDSSKDGMTTSGSNLAKSDYAEFTNCMQSSLLDQCRNVVVLEPNLDSLSGLCDLKFPSPNPHGVGSAVAGTSNGSGDSGGGGAINCDNNFRHHLTLMNSLEAKTLPQTTTDPTVAVTTVTTNSIENINNNNNNSNAIEPVPSFTNLLFGNHRTSVDGIGIGIDPKLTQNSNNNSLSIPTVATTPEYHTLKTPQKEASNFHTLTNATLATATATTSNNVVVAPFCNGYNAITTTAAIAKYNFGLALSSVAAAAAITKTLTTTATTMSTIAAASTTTTTNSLKQQQQQQQNAYVADSSGLIGNSNININNNNNNNTKLADNQITTTTTTTSIIVNSNNNNTADNHHHNNNNNINNNNTRANILHNNDDLVAANSCTSSSSSSSTTATTILNANRHNNNNNNSNSSSSNTTNKNYNNNKHRTAAISNNSNNNINNINNISNSVLQILDSDSDSDSISSQEDLIIDEHSGYQDTTSSHSQQSGGTGGGGGGGGGGSSVSGMNNTSSSSLLNGGNSGGNAGGGNSGGYMSLLPPGNGGNGSSVHLGGNTSGPGGIGGGNSSGTSASAGHSGEAIDFKHLFEELCPVCGDKVSGYHYGLLTCESCKGFFKRTVQNKKVYTCVAERSCHIDKTQRKRCPYCRFQKCLEVGMKLEAVRADRMRGGRNKFGPMYKRDRARKLQVMRQRQLALQALRSTIGTTDMKPTPLSPGYQQAYPNMNIKQEIQIPQVSSLTQSPDSSPSPIAIALGQVNASSGVLTTPMNGNNGSTSGTGSGGGNGGGGGGGGSSGNGNGGNSNNSDIINRGSGGNSCHDAGTGSLQNTGESKLCFDSGTHPSSTADSLIEPLRVSPMIRDFVQSIDDREWQTQLFALLQKQTYNQVEVDLFELMCKVLDQNLFSQVDWARNTVFFKDLKVDDQMKLLQHSWSDMLVLDHLHHRLHNGLPDETQLNNGQVFDLLSLGLLGVPQLGDFFNELQNKLQDLKFDMGDYVCMKFLILLNPDVRGIINKKTVLEGHENVQAALLDYTLTCYPSVTDKFRRLLNILPDIHAMASRGEEHLYSKHCAGSAPTQTLLMEMLHAKRKV